MIQLGISAFYHDSSACIVSDGKVLAAVEEERFTGIKHDSSFPINSIDWLFSYLQISPSEIDQVCWYEKPSLKEKRVLSSFNKNLLKTFFLRRKFLKEHFSEKKIAKLLKEVIGYRGEIVFVNHHKSHSSFSYFTSPFSKATVVSIDGVGESESVSIYQGVGDNLKEIQKIDYPNSPGMLYSTLTAYLGFKPNEGEYKVMGLSAYGNYKTFYSKLSDLVELENDGKIKIDTRHFSWETSDEIMFKPSLCDYLGIPPRMPHDPIGPDHKDLAAATQRIYEIIFLHILSYAKNVTGDFNLCLGGGCAYNGLANSLAYQIFDRVWVPFSPSDSGSSIGACLSEQKENRKDNTDPFLGPEFYDDEIELSLEGLSYQKMEEHTLIDRVAQDINSGKIVASFRGRMEFGARALGNRSILASPLIEKMKDRLNAAVKKRESFRPFAPSCTEDSYKEYFSSRESVPYMNQIVQVKSQHFLPSITHVDGTSRLHTVNENQNRYYYKLLIQLEKISGYPICLNTSFNFKDQTITMTPSQAVERFLDSDIDVLVMNNFYVEK